MSKSELVLIGAGGHARSCIDIIEACGEFRIAGLVGQANELRLNKSKYGIIATDSELAALAKRYKYALVAVGQIQSPDTRIRLYEDAINNKFIMPAVISPLAHVSKYAYIGEGSIVMHGAIVNSGANVGCNCIINTRSLVEHDAVVEDHCHISTGAIINGTANIGVGSFIGSASVLKEGVRVGKRCVVGMGVVVRNHLDNGSKYLGK